MNRIGNRANFKRTMNILGEERWKYLTMTIACNLIVSVCYNIVLAVVFQNILDGIVYHKKELLQGGVIIALVSFVIAFSFEPLITRTRNKCIRKTSAKVRNQIFQNIAGMSVRDFETRKQGEFFNRITRDIEVLEQIYLMHIPNLLFALLHGGIAMVLMIYYNPVIGLFSILLGVLQAVIDLKIGKKITKSAAVKQEKYIGLEQNVIDAMNGIIDIWASHGQKYYGERFGKCNLDYCESKKSVETKKICMQSVDNFFGNFNNIFVYGLGLLMVANAKVSVGEIVAIISLQGNASYLFGNISSFLSGLADSFPAVFRVEQSLEIPLEDEEQSDFMENACEKKEEAAIAIKHLNFSYNEDRKILDNIDFDVKKNKITLLMGESGAGKSTLLKIILGMYKSKKQEYFLNGVDTFFMESKEIRKQIAYFDQESFLFHNSILDNIILDKSDVGIERVISECKEIGIDDFISKLSNGYHTIVSNSELLSGGQKQLIVLARVIISGKPIILIDEGTASLDAQTEKKFVDYILKKKSERTFIMVCHKNTWKNYAYKTLLLSKGRIVESDLSV